MFEATKPDGTKRKLMETNKIKNLGWKNKIALKDGIRITINEFILSPIYNQNQKEMVK